MSSTVLYLAIVAVWAVVLVPMWLRRDTEATAFSRLLHKKPDESLDEPTLEEETGEAEETLDEDTTPAPRRRPGRAAVIARRRRRTTGLGLLVATSIAVISTGLAPWWVTIPPTLLLVGHLALLRVAVEMDATRHRAEAEERAQARAEARRLAETQETAEVIELVQPAEEEVFDQYADDRRVVGG
ncbi:hypothetical protein J4573_08690 [Actinomadura barringtoniae]|uniref:Uncharacterized protein n=1 Tax=Actinomadura barringtoniae TaxID=1427535 RepID=A0A939T8Q4_9ACTN|nr:hypothetical protein [Actinomadura barringtoniae]MBO2447160.1 hypothetical protein [Actinomadura barringtoniae]